MITHLTTDLTELETFEPDCCGPDCGRIFGRIVIVEILGWFEGC